MQETSRLFFRTRLTDDGKPSVFLLQAGRLSGNLGISGKQERSENADDNDVAEECECTLQEDLAGRLSIDGDIQNRSNENPCSSIGNDLNNVEQNDVLLVEAAFFYRKFLCKSADCNADVRVGLNQPILRRAI